MTNVKIQKGDRCITKVISYDILNIVQRVHGLEDYLLTVEIESDKSIKKTHLTAYIFIKFKPDLLS